jgi:hypothetical protein
MPPGVNEAADGPADASMAALLSALERRIKTYSVRREPASVLARAAEAEAAAVLDARVRETLRSYRVDLPAMLRALNLTGVLFYLRFLQPEEENPKRERDLHLALALLAPVHDTGSSAVPPQIADCFRETGQPGELLTEIWTGCAGMLLEVAGRADRTALLAAVAVDQLSLAVAESHPERSPETACLGNLALNLTALYELDGDYRTLPTAVALGNWLVVKTAETPGMTHEHDRAVDQLSTTMRHVDAQQGGQRRLLSEAIVVAKKIVAAGNGDPRDLVPRSYALGVLLNNRYADFHEAADGGEAAVVLRTVAKSPSATIGIRLESAWHAGKIAMAQGDWSNGTDDLAVAVGLLPRLARSHEGSRGKERALEKYAPLPCVAAECAAAAGQPERAVELLERGRGVLSASSLKSAPPELPEILAAASQGPIAIPVLGRYQSVALLVTRDRIRHVRLDQLNYPAVRDMWEDIWGGAERALDPRTSAAARMTGEYSLRAGLAKLWDTVVSPVLDALRDEPCIQERGGLGGAHPPRMWWCPTGLLSWFPFHMAARHGEDDAFELVHSSYTPTVHALSRADDRWRPAKDSRPLVVALPQTPGAVDLPSADREAAILRSVFPEARLLRGRAASRAKVTAVLPSHDIVHIVCHGGDDRDRGFESYLALHDGPMHIADIEAMRVGRPAGLAFLSSCSAARVRLDLPDESRSVLTAFKSAGFSHVVGSLWEVAEQANSDLVNHFYTALTAETSTADTVAAALRHAIRRLREQEQTRERPSVWASHVHIGL